VKVFVGDKDIIKVNINNAQKPHGMDSSRYSVTQYCTTIRNTNEVARDLIG
jgi:hypothetical protein